MKVGKHTRTAICCVFAQLHGMSVKQKHIRLEVNAWREDKKMKPLGVFYFGLVMNQLKEEGFAKIVRGTQMPFWDDFKVWAAA